MAADCTPTPWRVFPGDKSSVYSDTGDVLIVQVGDELLCNDDEMVPEPDEAVSNAAFIVRACNTHYQMLEALKALDASWTAEFPAGPDTEDLRYGIGRLSEETVGIWKQIRAAIAAAEAEGR